MIGTFSPAEAVGKCVYCNHCKPCPRGLDIGIINKYYDLARNGDSMAAERYRNLEVRADACVQCGHCEARCPFHVKHRPNELSGGQKQRVSIARALVGNPSVLLADEPTGALDQASGRDVLKLFKELNEMGNTIVMITHDPEVAQSARRIVRIVDGVLVEHNAADASPAD